MRRHVFYSVAGWLVPQPPAQLDDVGLFMLALQRKLAATPAVHIMSFEGSNDAGLSADIFLFTLSSCAKSMSVLIFIEFLAK